jgi:hypothetical protein
MKDGLYFWLPVIGYCSFGFTAALMMYHLIQFSLPSVHRRMRLRALSFDLGLEKRLPGWLRAILLPRSLAVREQFKELLFAAGAGIDVAVYFILKRCMASAAIILAGWSIVGWDEQIILQVWGFTMSIVILIAAGFDRVWLEQSGRHRRNRIIREIYHLCHQLSYYAGARMNLHGKLTKCTPFTRKIRTEWTLLLQEWYEDPDEALYRFRTRLGTDEAYSFSETLGALRQGESEAFYQLLRQRIASYKEHMELYQEGKQESYSYMLFVLAGIPIMNTFRVFVHPWVEEGRKLFDTLQ